MTVTVTGRVRFLPFRTPPNPSQPAGLWTSQLTAIGDASGGDLFLITEVNLLTEPFSALMLTIEQIMLTDTSNAGRTWTMEATGFEEHDPVGNRNVIYDFVTSATGPTSATALNQSGTILKPIFLGRCDRTSGQDSSIRVITDNIDVFTFRQDLWGYFWTPDAMNAPGGPQRPPGALFGT